MRWLSSYPFDGPSVSFYDRWVRLCGAEPVFVDARYTHPGALSDYAALLLPGGGDVHPARYGALPHPAVDGVNEARDELETELLRAFMEVRRPVLGICRGIQLFNVALGGGLIQHIPDVLSPEEERHAREDSTDSVHPLSVVSDSRLGRALASVTLSNSAHHQAVDPARLGRGLRVTAWSAGGIVEAVESLDPHLALSAVQWHPERMAIDHPASALLRDHWCAILAETRSK